MPEQERQRVAKIFKTYVEKAVDELGPGYMVDLQGNFYATHPSESPLKFLLTENSTQKRRTERRAM